MTNDTANPNTKLIADKLNEAFKPTHLNIIDESHLHKGHADAQPGKGHYAVSIRSAAFVGKTPTARHRMVYQALGNLMETHIHALSIRAVSTQEQPRQLADATAKQRHD